MDFIAQWQLEGTFLEAYEQAFLDRELPKAIRGNFHSLEPVGAPWLRPLADLRWLVISPFCQTISTQLHKLPQLNIFHGVPAESLARIAATCRLLPCPQLPYMVPPRHRDWFHGLGEMQEAMNAVDFDVAIVGAGAWSIPLAVHAKKLGRIGMHLGGTINLLFGIRGGRFEDRGLYNDHLIRPLPSECPTNHKPGLLPHGISQNRIGRLLVFHPEFPHHSLSSTHEGDFGKLLTERPKRNFFFQRDLRKKGLKFQGKIFMR
jgi:hypothetical protein